MNSKLDKQTLFELLQVQIVQYLMIEKYGLRADRNCSNPLPTVISKAEVEEDLEELFGKNNSQMVEALWWVINDAVYDYDPTGWDEK